MLRRAMVIALLAFQAIWLNVILPGHTRGVVTLSSFKPSAEYHEDVQKGAAEEAQAPGCCGTPASQNDKKNDSGPTKNRAAHCAVCFFAARLSLPTTIDLTPAALELLEQHCPAVADSLVSRDIIPTYLGRAPPIG